MFRFLIISILALSLASGLAACSDTWQGIKKDTGDNLKSTGSAVDK